MATVLKIGDWRLAERVLDGLVTNTHGSLMKAMLMEGEFLRGHVVKGIRAQAPGGKEFKPLSPTTLAIRRFMGFGGSKALIRTGFLIRSIQVLKQGRYVLVGIHRSVRTPDGKQLVRIAELMEYGSDPIVIHMTDKMRRFLFAAFNAAGLPRPEGGSEGGERPPSTHIIIIQIPARPFFGPVFERFAKPKDVRTRFQKNMSKLLGFTGR